MNRWPSHLSWQDRLRAESEYRLPRCDECSGRTRHWPWCSQAPPDERERWGDRIRLRAARRYAEAEQRAHYRQAARDRGCTCPELPPHIHLVECPLYRTAEEWRDHLDQEHEGA